MKASRSPWIRGVLWLLAGVALWCCASAALTTRAVWYLDRASYRGSVSADKMAELRKQAAEGGGNVTAWGQTLSESVSVKETDGSATVDTLWVDGDAALCWNLPVVAGNLPGLSDTVGCALDEGTALSLFGSLDIIGREVTLAGQTLTVRGVFRLPSGAPAFGVDPGRGLAFAPSAAAPDSLTLSALEFSAKPADGKTSAERATEWMQSAGMPTGGAMDDHAEQSALLSVLVSLPALLLGAMAVLELGRAALRIARGASVTALAVRNDPVRPSSDAVRIVTCGLAGIVLFAGAAAGVLLLTPPLRTIPPSYLPTRWSDFGFWSDMITDGGKDAATAALSVALRPDMVFDSLAGRCGWMAALSLPMLWFARRAFVRGCGETPALAACAWGAAAVAAAPLGVFAAGLLGFTASVADGMPLLPALFYMAAALTRIGDPGARFVPWASAVRLRLPKAPPARTRGVRPAGSVLRAARASAPHVSKQNPASHL